MAKRIVWVLPFMAFFLCGCGVMDAAFDTQRIQGSGIIKQERREVSGFSGVNFAGWGELNVRQGNEESLVIEADDNLLPQIRADVENDRLVIGLRRGVSVSTSSPMRFTLVVTDLDSLELSGSGKMRIGPLRSGAFRLRVSGSGDIRMEGLDASTLTAEISGSGNMEIPGKVDRQEVHISGSGSYHAPDLECRSAEISVSGSGDSTIRVAETLSARISGSGSVRYYGNPSVTKKISGSGNIRQLGER